MSHTPLSKERLLAHLGDAPVSLQLFDSLPSTNESLLAAAREGEKEGALFVTAHQSAGRGRKDRTFFSPADCGVYFSLLLRPKAAESASVTKLTAAAALAVCRAAKSLGERKCEIKWVNDVYLHGKKVCGILTQGILDPRRGFEAIAVGIGINVTEPAGGYPAEIAGRAGALFQAQDKEDLREALCGKTVRELLAIHTGGEDVLPEYRRLSCVLGRRVEVLGEQTRFFATAREIDENFHLIVEDENKTRHTLFSGEVSLVL